MKVALRGFRARKRRLGAEEAATPHEPRAAQRESKRNKTLLPRLFSTFNPPAYATDPPSPPYSRPSPNPKVSTSQNGKHTPFPFLPYFFRSFPPPLSLPLPTPAPIRRCKASFPSSSTMEGRPDLISAISAECSPRGRGASVTSRRSPPPRETFTQEIITYSSDC